MNEQKRLCGQIRIMTTIRIGMVMCLCECVCVSVREYALRQSATDMLPHSFHLSMCVCVCVCIVGMANKSIPVYVDRRFEFIRLQK